MITNEIFSLLFQPLLNEFLSSFQMKSSVFKAQNIKKKKTKTTVTMRKELEQNTSIFMVLKSWTGSSRKVSLAMNTLWFSL